MADDALLGFCAGIRRELRHEIDPLNADRLRV